MYQEITTHRKESSLMSEYILENLNTNYIKFT